MAIDPSDLVDSGQFEPRSIRPNTPTKAEAADDVGANVARQMMVERYPNPANYPSSPPENRQLLADKNDPRWMYEVEYDSSGKIASVVIGSTPPGMEQFKDKRLTSGKAFTDITKMFSSGAHSKESPNPSNPPSPPSGPKSEDIWDSTLPMSISPKKPEDMASRRESVAENPFHRGMVA